MAAPPVPPRPHSSSTQNSGDLAPPVPPLPPGFVRSPSQERPLIPPPPPPPPLPLQSLPRLHTPLASPVPQRSYSSTPGDITRSLESSLSPSFPVPNFGNDAFTTPYMNLSREPLALDALRLPPDPTYQTAISSLVSPGSVPPLSPAPHLLPQAPPVIDRSISYPLSPVVSQTIPLVAAQHQHLSPRPANGQPNGDKRYDVTAPAVFRPLLIPFAPINPLPSLGDPPVLTVSLPTQPSLSSAAQSVKTINNPSRQVSWSKQVLDLVERIQISERRLYNDNLAPNLDPRLEVLVDQAIQHILSLSQIPGKPLYPYAAEAIYLRGTLAASGSFPAYIKRDLRAAFKDFETAARNSFDPAWFRIGRDYEGVNQIEKARECYERGVKIEEKNCLYRMGMAQLLGQLGLSINQRAAIPLLKHAADWSDVDTPQPAYVFGMLLLGEYSHLELPASTFAPYLPNSHAEPRMIEARRYIEHAAYLNFAPAQCKAGWAYEYSKMGCPYDPLLSVQYYSLASQQGEEEADMALSKWFLCGAEGCFDKDEHLAFTFAEKAARRGFPIAEFAMGYYHEVGVGCNIDVAVARKWYTRASKRGNTDASERLRALNERNPSVLSREEHDSLAQNTLIRKRTLAREASKAAGRKATSNPGDGTRVVKAARQAIETPQDVGPEPSRPELLSPPRVHPSTESQGPSSGKIRTKLRRLTPAKLRNDLDVQLKPVTQAQGVQNEITAEELAPATLDEADKSKIASGDALPAKKGPSTFEEMGYKSQALGDKECIIM